MTSIYFLACLVSGFLFCWGANHDLKKKRANRTDRFLAHLQLLIGIGFLAAAAICATQ